MQVNELITRLREDYLDDTIGVDTDDSLVTEKSLIRFAKEAQYQACRRNDLIYDEDTQDICEITLVAGQRVYPINELITRIERVSYDGNDLYHTTEEALNNTNPYWRQSTKTNPARYYMRQTSIYLDVTPDAVSAQKPLRLAVYRNPKNDIINRNQSFEIVREAQDDLIYWMLYRVYNLRDEDLNDPTNAKMYFEEFVASYGEVVPIDVRIHQFEEPTILQHWPSDEYTFSNVSNQEDDEFNDSGW